MPDPTPIEVLTEASPSAAEAFGQLRSALSSGVLDTVTEELVVIGALAAKGQLGSLAVHVRRALRDGVSIAEIRGAILAPLAAASLFGEVIAALKTVNSVVDSLEGSLPVFSPKTAAKSWPTPPTQEFTAPLSATLVAPEHPSSVVLLHSLALDRSIWTPVANILSTQFAVLVCDLPGHGKSQLAAEATIESMADSVASLIKAAGLNSAVVIGLSLGGSVAQALAVRHPDKVSALGLVDTTSYYGPEAPSSWGERADQAQRVGLESLSSFQLERWFSDDFRKGRSDLCESVLEIFLRTDLEGYKAACKAFAAMDLRSGIEGITCPTAIVVGEQDRATPPADARQMHERIQGSHLHIMPGCKHLSAVERPMEVLTALAPILGVH